MQWWYAHQPFPPGYLYKNVPLLGDFQKKVLEGMDYVCQYLGDPIFVHATSFGFYSHQSRWLWTNLACPCTLAATIFIVLPPFDQKVDDILDPHRTSLSIGQDDLFLLELVNKLGAPWRAFATFVTFIQLFVFRDQGPNMVWGDHTKTHT